MIFILLYWTDESTKNYHCMRFVVAGVVCVVACGSYLCIESFVVMGIFSRQSTSSTITDWYSIIDSKGRSTWATGWSIRCEMIDGFGISSTTNSIIYWMIVYSVMTRCSAVVGDDAVLGRSIVIWSVIVFVTTWTARSYCRTTQSCCRIRENSTNVEFFV